MGLALRDRFKISMKGCICMVWHLCAEFGGCIVAICS